MKILVSMSAFIALLCLLSQEAFPDALRFEKSKNEPEAVLAQAESIARNSDVIIDDYNLEGLSFDYLKRSWTVFYSSESLALGDHFIVSINDDDVSDSRIIGGL